MGNLEQAFHDLATEQLLEQLDLARRRNASRYGVPGEGDASDIDRGQWRAIQCAPRQERHVVSDLTGRNFPAYCPSLWMRERHGRGNLREIERPMFPGYAFVRCLPEHISVVRNLCGVAGRQGTVLGVVIPLAMRMVKVDLCRLSEQAIDAVRLAEACHATKAGRKQLRWDFSLAERIRIVDGPFAGFFATIAGEVDDHGRIAALASIFGRSTLCHVDADDLEKL